MFKNTRKFITILMAVVLVSVLATSAFAAPAFQGDKTIVDIAVEDGRFTTLVTALQAADLVETLSGEGPFTVFAPTDDAFAALPDGALEGLLADIPALTDVLLYHVVSGEVLAADVIQLPAADTVLGQPVTITVDDDKVMVNDAQVIITDIQGSNGVIHVIDAVILPPQDEAPATLPISGGETSSSTNYVLLLSAAGLLLLISGIALHSSFSRSK